MRSPPISSVRTSNWGIVELIEAAVRAGTPEQAAEGDARLEDMTRVSGTDWALGVAARSQALLAEDERAEDLYRDAIDRLGRSRMAVDLARAHLLYGEWLRRERRRLDACEELRTALRPLLQLPDRGGRRTRSGGAPGHGRTCAEADTRDAGPTHPAGDADLAPCSPRKHQPRDRGATIHQPEHGRVPPP
jgi:hypothetical protein